MTPIASLIRKPHITEKSTRLKDGANTLCFRVDPSATKVDIRQAVEKMFGTKVARVHIVKVAPKLKRHRGTAGYRPGWRKAYVKLKPGQKPIEYFEGA
jgi:large subunit ribosomal protein L23